MNKIYPKTLENCLFWIVGTNFVLALLVTTNPAYSIISIVAIFIAYELPDILLDPFEIKDLIIYSLISFSVGILILVLTQYFDFNMLGSYLLALPLLVCKDIWFYFKYKVRLSQKKFGENKWSNKGPE